MVSERVRRQIDRLLDGAQEAISRYDWDTVPQAAQALLAIDPGNSDAITYLTSAERALGATPTPTPLPQAADGTPTEPPYTAVTTPEAERRQVTVMFCDLQGSTALSQQLDPEDLRDVIRSYQEVCAGAVTRFGGHIAKYLGDGLLIYFGYPQAHEDDPQRAVHAGLAILKDMADLNARLQADKDLELTVRIGVHTGLVVAGEMGGGDAIEELAIVGETPNIAARLQELAEPNSEVISDITSNLVQGYFICEELGIRELKGISQPMELFRAIEESDGQTRFDVSSAIQLTPLLGRDQELGLLLDRWEQVKEGLGQVVLLSGEPGIGKSRLIDALTERLVEGPITLRQLRCSAYHQNSALHPVTELLESWLNIRPGDSTERKLSKLEDHLAGSNFPISEAASLLAGLLSLQVEGRFPLLTLSPEGQKSRTNELLVALLLNTGDDRPVCITVED